MKLTVLALVLYFSCLNTSSAQTKLNPQPTRVLGQDSIQVSSFNPNLVEGRELYVPEGIALDTSTNPPALYVSDTANNRVLGFRSATTFANGQPADVVLGQADFISTFSQGPGHALTTGLHSPTGVAVDSKGNVYVVDTGNNRILRFPQPFSQAGQILPDFVLGQTSFSSGDTNQGGSVSAASLSFVSSTVLLQAFLTFDASGNLWVSDAGNNRVLRFNSSVLGAQASSGPPADIVLGQDDFLTGTYNPPAKNASLSLTSFSTPSGLTFDAAGRLFVAESTTSGHGRILMWAPPFASGQRASGLLGVDTDTPAPAAVNAVELGASPGGLFAIGTSIGAVDPANNRILVFPPVEQWTPGATYQAALEVAGQPDFAGNFANRGQPTAGPDRFSRPAAAVFFGAELYVADAGNNRVIVMPQSGSLPNATFGPASRVLGQDLLTLNAPNLVEGKEFDFGTQSFDAGLAVDLTSNPPHLYVADTYNNRILGFNDLRNLTTGGKADIVIGQPDFQQVLVNYPNNSASQTNASGLYLPTGLTVDPSGNLYVADRGNGRVLRFPQPFVNYAPDGMEQADLVLGQSGFSNSKIVDPTSRTMSQPYGLAFTQAGGLLVSDIALNRVLYFEGPSGNLRSGMTAGTVLGQPDFNSSGSGSGSPQMNAPRHIATDSDDRLYVADTGNARIDIFDNVPAANPGQAAAQFLTNGIRNPRGIYVSSSTGEIWVADASTGAVRYPAFNQLVVANGAPNATLTDNAGPLAVAEDAWGNLLLADAAHRVGIFYPGLSPINAANFLNAGGLAPGMIAALYSQGNPGQFGGQAAQAATLPLPTQLNGVSVLFNGAPAPLFYAGPNQINFEVPMSAPQSGYADLQVIDVASGRILGDTTVTMTQTLPGLFTQAGNGSGAAAALNQDNTLNTAAHPAAQGTVITLFGTGQGFISGAPPDGNVSNAQLQTASTPTLIMGTGAVPAGNIKYSGLAPTLAGVWQINVLIPDTVISTATNPTQVVVIQNNVASGGGGLNRPVIIYVKQK
ncbi:MAG: hypothetical protein M3N93_05930 [Acidobacteriota bacterium]|nr:hypothetical protein [Acidobacteriota bacterium]